MIAVLVNNLSEIVAMIGFGIVGFKLGRYSKR